MKHIVYISPNAREYHSATMQDLALAASNNPRETLESLRNRSEEEVLLFESPEQLARAFNNDGTISDEGFLLIIDDHVSERDAILAVIRRCVDTLGVTLPAGREGGHPCKVIDLLPKEGLGWDEEADNALNALSEKLPAYLVASNRDGEWFEERVRRVILSDNGTLSFELESGFTADATDPFAENLVSIKEILLNLSPEAVAAFHEKYA